MNTLYFLLAIFAMTLTPLNAHDDLQLRILTISSPLEEDSVLPVKFEVEIEIVNKSKKAIEIFDIESAFGKELVSFAFSDPKGALIRVYRWRLGNFRGLPKTVIIDPGGSKKYSFDLMDGSWHAPLNIGDGSSREILAELNAPSIGSETCGYQSELWAGRLVSEPQAIQVPMRYVFKDNALPFWPAAPN